MSDEPTTDVLITTRDRTHPNCVVCTPGRAQGLGLAFAAGGDGAVEATFACDPVYEGYPGYVQGGIVAALLDGAMTNCLFATGRVSLTAEMTVRYQAPVLVGENVTVRARLERARTRFQLLTAEVVQGGEVKASATGKFLRFPGS